MIVSTTTKSPAKINDRTWKLVPSTIPNGPGVTHGRLTENEFMFNVSTKNLKIQTLTIGAKMNGTKKIGLNKIGSLTPKNVGTTEARPMARLRSDLQIHMNKNGTINVAPVPPMVTINI